MSNLVEIQNQIEKLQKQASEIKAREFDKTVQEIVAKMQAFGITLKDLQPGKKRGPKAKAKIAVATKSAGGKVKKTGDKVASVVAAKYRGKKGAEAEMIKKVKAGGKGVWGDMPMPPNAHVKDDDIKTVVQWILSIK